jgi:aldose 1-epimerase
MTKQTKTSFGASGAQLYCIENSVGSQLFVSDFGATVIGLKVPGDDGVFRDVIMGYDSAADYAKGSSYQGATVGRFANRIANASLELNGRQYVLDSNTEHGHCLHGGRRGFHQRMWQALPLEADACISFQLTSPDGDQGMPGKLDIRVSFSLSDDNTFSIHYLAISDADTLINLTNHSYFNLNGVGAAGIEDHFLWIDADYFTPTDAHSIPTGEIRPVCKTAFDFRTEKRIGRDIEANEPQLQLAGGYDQNFVLNGDHRDKPAAKARAEKSGITMEVFTDRPGIQFYSGNYLGGEAVGKQGFQIKRRSAFCLETQSFPDAPHHPAFPSAQLKADELFESITAYRFNY